MTTGPHELHTKEFAELIGRLRDLPKIGNEAAGNLQATPTAKHFSRELLQSLEATRQGLRNLAERDDRDVSTLLDKAMRHLQFAQLADQAPWMWDALHGLSGPERW